MKTAEFRKLIREEIKTILLESGFQKLKNEKKTITKIIDRIKLDIP